MSQSDPLLDEMDLRIEMEEAQRLTGPALYYVFDIETLAQSEEVVRSFMPKEIAEPTLPAELEEGTPPDFHNKAIKDEGKQAVWRAEKVAAWTVEKKAKIEKWQRERMDAELKFLNKACLNAETAEVPLICVLDPDGVIQIFAVCKPGEVDLSKFQEVAPFVLHDCGCEVTLLRAFWLYVRDTIDRNLGARFIGWNSNKFDLGMLRRRSWIQGVRILVSIMAGSYVDKAVWLDLMEQWQSGDRQLYVGVDQASRALGCKARKTGGGGDFGALWRRSKTEAIVYCMRDVLAEGEICGRIML